MFVCRATAHGRRPPPPRPPRWFATPSDISKIFSTDPVTDDRITAAQNEIQQDLKPKDEYVVNISEFEDVKVRLARLENKRKVDNKDPGRPQLRRAPGSGGTPVPNDDGTESKPDSDDDRPTLKRAPGQ